MSSDESDDGGSQEQSFLPGGNGHDLFGGGVVGDDNVGRVDGGTGGGGSGVGGVGASTSSSTRRHRSKLSPSTSSASSLPSSSQAKALARALLAGSKSGLSSSNNKADNEINRLLLATLASSTGSNSAMGSLASTAAAAAIGGGGGATTTKSASSRTRPVVKLLVNSVCRSYTEPWRRKSQRESSGTGFVIRWMEPCSGAVDADAERMMDTDDTMEIETESLVHDAADNKTTTTNTTCNKKSSDNNSSSNNNKLENNNETQQGERDHHENQNNDQKENTEKNEEKKTQKQKPKQKQSLRIVTNAHVVRNASTVRARASFGPHVVSCEVEWLSLPLDLALLKITEGDWSDFCQGWNFLEEEENDKKEETNSNEVKMDEDTFGGKEDAKEAKEEDDETKQDNTVSQVEKEEKKTIEQERGGKSSSGKSKNTDSANNNNKMKKNNNTSPPLNCLTLSTSLPKLDENVTCVGFPQGGTQISVTRGVVSRIDVNSQYVLRIQIDAAINSGNSGGPVFDEQGQVVGVASSVLRGAGNIGYIVPGKIVDMFLGMCRDGMEADVEERFSGLGSLILKPNNNSGMDIENDNDTAENVDNNDNEKDNTRHRLEELTMLTSEMAQEPKHVPGIPSLAIHGAQTLESKALRKSLGLEELGITGGIRIIGVRGGKVPRVGAGINLDEDKEGECISGGFAKKRKANGDEILIKKSTCNESDGQDITAATTADKGVSVDLEPSNENKLQANDVLLAINNVPIGMDGTIQLSPTRPDERINFRSIVTSQRVGSKVVLDVLRDGKRKQLEVTLGITRFIVPQYDGFDACPLYAVCGGCVFAPLSLPLISDKNGKRKNSCQTFNRYYQDEREDNDQVLILSRVLADEVNVGYHGWSNLLLKSINGYEPRNMQELVDVMVRKLDGEMVEFRCQMVGLEEADFVICMKMKEVLQSEQRILHRHMISSWCSTDALSSGLQQRVDKAPATDAEKAVCWNTMKGLRSVLEQQNK